jgi:hypothetical protein
VAEREDAAQGTWPPAQALLDVKGGVGWKAARVPVGLELREGSLRITVEGEEFSRKERKALDGLFGGEAKAGGPEQLSVDVDLASATLAFPRVPSRRSWIVIELPGRPTFRLYFLDWKDLEKRPGSMVAMGKHAADSRSAAAAREAWREQLEQ